MRPFYKLYSLSTSLRLHLKLVMIKHASFCGSTFRCTLQEKRSKKGQQLKRRKSAPFLFIEKFVGRAVYTMVRRLVHFSFLFIKTTKVNGFCKQRLNLESFEDRAFFFFAFSFLSSNFHGFISTSLFNTWSYFLLYLFCDAHIQCTHQGICVLIFLLSVHCTMKHLMSSGLVRVPSPGCKQANITFIHLSDHLFCLLCFGIIQLLSTSL